MRALSLSSLAIPLLLSAAPALADVATPEGAKELGSVVAAYLGRPAIDRGIISIEPKGDAYLATFDAQRALEALEAPSGSLTIDPWSFLIAPVGSGAWKVTTDQFPKIDFNMPADKGPVAGSLHVNGFRFEGVYDPKLAVFITSTTSYGSFDLKMHVPDPAAGEPGDVEYHQGAGTTESTATDAGGGAVTVIVKQKIDGAKETIFVAPPAAEGGRSTAPVQATFDIGPASAGGAIAGMRAPSLRDLWAFVVAAINDHANLDAADFQSGLKGKLLAVLPIWDNFSATGAARDMKMQAAGVSVEAKTFSETVTMSGLNARSSLGFGFKTDGLHVASELLPPWVEPLMPTAMDLDMKLTASGLDQISRIAIDQFDSASDPPFPPLAVAKMSALLAAGEPKLTFAPSHLTSPSLDLSYEGEMALTTPKPTAKFAVAADGLDKVLAILSKSAESDPQLQQAVLGVTFLKGLAKQGSGGKLTWNIDLAADGAVTVNGLLMPATK
jgi:hypothetical protein